MITDSNGDVYISGYFRPNGPSSTSSYTYFKLNGENGNTLYIKSWGYLTNVDLLYSVNPVFDSQNNLILFLEPVTDQAFYTFDGITIPSSGNGTDSVMLKLDPNGNVIYGKNFYAHNSHFSYSWINDAVFDGENILLLGSYSSDSAENFYLGMNGTQIPKSYSNTLAGLLAKIDLDGNVLWEKPIESKNSRGFITNIELDENKNIYSYLFLEGKIKFNNIEYNFDFTKGNKVLSKFDNSGNLKYLKTIDTSNDKYGEPNQNYKNYHKSIDVIGEDQVNVTAFTEENSLLNYPLNNNVYPKAYIATFGNLDSKYLTAESNYFSLSHLEMSNNPENNNNFSFNLISNVNWMASSDQSWLTLNYTKLSQKGILKSLADFGDAKITLTAETNSSGISRTANILLSGDGGVASKTISVTQSGLLATGEIKTFITALYPNPTSDVLNIETKQKISKIELFDWSGKLIQSNDGKEKKISVSELIKGIYLIYIYTENGVVKSKFIKN